MLTIHAVTPIVFTPALFEIFQILGLQDTHIGLSLIYATFALPLTVWILKNFLDGFSTATEEAAKVDGASLFDIIFRIVLPQIRVGLAVAAVFAFSIAWNDFIFTLTLTETNASTFVFLADFFDDLLRVGVLTPGPLTSMSIVHMVPSFIFAFLVQRYLLIGFSAGTIKQEVE
jgi:ABC-type glycerol-3-phosphate transport system permease component